MKKVILSWAKYQADAVNLAKKIKTKPDLIIAISRGGLVAGVLLSHILKKPLAVITAASYHGQKRTGLKFGTVSSTEKIKGTVLLVDDLIDSGETMKKISNILPRRYPIKKLITATLYIKYEKHFKPDYYVKKLTGWAVFPYEK